MTYSWLQCTCAQSPWLCLIHYTCATVYMCSLHDCVLFIIHVLQCTCAQSPRLCFIHYTCATVYMCSVSTTVAYSLCLVPWEAWQWQISHTSVVRVREHSYASKTLIDTDVWLLVENISYCDLVCHLWQRSIIQWVAFFQGSRCVCVYVCVCGVVVVSHTQAVFHFVFHLPPTSPTSPLSCDWVPGCKFKAFSHETAMV